MELSLGSDTYRSRQTGAVNLVWLQRLNRYIRLEEPAFRVFEELARGATPAESGKIIAKRYRIPEGEARRFSEEVRHQLEILYGSYTDPAQPVTSLAGLLHSAGQFTKKTILVEGKKVRFCFGDSALSARIYPIFSHLEANLPPEETDLYMEVFRRGRRLCLVINREKGFSWKLDELHLLKGELNMQIVNLIHEEIRGRWMGVIHASAVSMEERAVLFPARAGKGKSTLAALLMAHGCGLVSDDFTPLAGREGRVFHFPAGISVKPGSRSLLEPYFPELSDNDRFVSPVADDCSAFIAPRNQTGTANRGSLVNGVIFVSYREDSGCHLKQVPPLDVISDFLQESWLQGDAETADQFMDWFLNIPCFTLEYSDSGMAVETIINLIRDAT